MGNICESKESRLGRAPPVNTNAVYDDIGGRARVDMLFTYDDPVKFAKELSDNIFNNYILVQYYNESSENNPNSDNNKDEATFSRELSGKVLDENEEGRQHLPGKTSPIKLKFSSKVREKKPIFKNSLLRNTDDSSNEEIIEKIKSDEVFISRVENAELKFECKPEILQSTIIINRLTTSKIDSSNQNIQNSNAIGTLISVSKNISNLFNQIKGRIPNGNRKFNSERSGVPYNNVREEFSSERKDKAAIEMSSENIKKEEYTDLTLTNKIQENLPEIKERSEHNDQSFLGSLLYSEYKGVGENCSNQDRGSFIKTEGNAINDKSEIKQETFVKKSSLKKKFPDEIKPKISLKPSLPILLFESEIKPESYDFEGKKSEIKLETKSYGRFSNIKERENQTAVQLGTAGSLGSFLSKSK